MSSTSGDIAGSTTRAKLKEVTADSKLDAAEYKELCTTADADKSLDTGTREAIKLLNPLKHGTNIQKDTGKGTIIDFVMGAVVTVAGAPVDISSKKAFDDLRDTIISQVEGGNADRLTAEQEGLIDHMLTKAAGGTGQVSKEQIQAIVRSILTVPNFTKEDVRAGEIAKQAPATVDKNNADQFQYFRNGIIAQIENGDSNKLSPDQESYLDSMLKECIGADGTVQKDKLQSITAFVLKNPNFTPEDMTAYNIAQQCPKNANIHNDESFQGLRNTIITQLGNTTLVNGDQLDKMLKQLADSKGNISPEAVQAVVAFMIKNKNGGGQAAGEELAVAADGDPAMLEDLNKVINPIQSNIADTGRWNGQDVNNYKIDSVLPDLKKLLEEKYGVQLKDEDVRKLLEKAGGGDGDVNASQIASVIEYCKGDRKTEYKGAEQNMFGKIIDGENKVKGSHDAWDMSVEPGDTYQKSNLSYNLAKLYGGDGTTMSKEEIRQKAVRIQTLLEKIVGGKGPINSEQLGQAIGMIMIGLDDQPELYDRRALVGGKLAPVSQGKWAGVDVNNYSVDGATEMLVQQFGITDETQKAQLRAMLQKAGGDDGDINQAQILHAIYHMKGKDGDQSAVLNRFNDNDYTPMKEPKKSEEADADKKRVHWGGVGGHRVVYKAWYY